METFEFTKRKIAHDRKALAQRRVTTGGLAGVVGAAIGAMIGAANSGEIVLPALAGALFLTAIALVYTETKRG